jgi:PTH2 family peptidyl-tRNA hydrolase
MLFCCFTRCLPRPLLAAARRGLRAAVGGVLGGSGKVQMTLVLRADLGMGKGKLCAQASHGTLNAYRAALQGGQASQEALQQWELTGQGKVVVRAESEAQLLELWQACQDRGLPSAVVRDAGLTQITCGSITCLAIGPARADVIGEVTGGLRLL